MNKEQQDLAWKCLPKEVRNEIKRKFNIAENDIDLFIQTLILEDIFGHHNLTSDTEPEEMLMVSKKRVMTELCRAVNLQDVSKEDWIRAGEEIEFTLARLFGDKCLPDEKSIVSNNETIDETIEEQPKPKFKVENLLDCLPESKRLKVIEKYHEYVPMAFNGFAVGYCAALRDVFGSDNLPIVK